MINTLTEIEYKISQLQANYSNRNLKVGFFGAFSTGKSTLINAILGQENLLPTHAIETTAKLTMIKYGETNYVNIHQKDGSIQTCELAVLADFVLNAENTEQIAWLEVFLNDGKLQNVEIIDTPGYNSLYESQKEQGLQALLDVDVAFYICRPEGITANDFAVLQMMSAQQPNINFVMNAIDVVPTSEQEYAKNMLEQKITEFTNARSQVLLTSAKTGAGISELTTLIFETLGQFVEAYQTEKANLQIINYLENQKKAIELRREIIETQLENPQLDQKLEMSNLKANLDEIETQIETQLKKQVGKLAEIIEQFKTKNQMEVRTTLSAVEQQFDTMYPNVETLSTIINKKIVDFSGQMQNEYLNTLAKTFDGIITEINSSPSLQFVDLQLPNIEEVAMQYEHQKNQVLAEVELEKQDTHTQIESLEEDKGFVRNSLSEFSTEVDQLGSKKNESYQPQYEQIEVLDEAAKQKTAVLKGIGTAGDIALSIGAAFLTAGGTAMLGIGTKTVAARAAQKTAAVFSKEAAKRLATEAAKKTLATTALSSLSSILNPCSALLGGVANGIAT
ncbi:MAG: dynamin family protein, partial [Culicoidibacterales bacterium]